jgi:hypothetical protein
MRWTGQRKGMPQGKKPLGRFGRRWEVNNRMAKGDITGPPDNWGTNTRTLSSRMGVERCKKKLLSRNPKK